MGTFLLPSCSNGAVVGALEGSAFLNRRGATKWATFGALGKDWPAEITRFLDQRRRTGVNLERKVRVMQQTERESFNFLQKNCISIFPSGNDKTFRGGINKIIHFYF